MEKKKKSVDELPKGKVLIIRIIPKKVTSTVQEKKEESKQSTPHYHSPKGYHRHKCDDCGHVWEHSNSCAGQHKPHECPNCGTEEGFQYFGPEAPTTVTK